MSNSWKMQLRAVLANIAYHSGLTSFLPVIKGENWRILMYHRVLPQCDVGYFIEPGMYVTPETFREHLIYLKRYCNVLSLTDLLLALENGETLKPRTLALTFDDGWLDNYKYAYPLLREFDIHASIFLATGYIETMRSYWSDEVSATLIAFNNQCAQYPEDSNGLLMKSGLSQDVLDLLSSVFFKRTVCNSFGPDSLDHFLTLLKGKGRESRADIVSKMRNLLIRPIAERVDFLNWEQVREMQRSKIISFGSHSHAHEYSTELDDDSFSRDLKKSQDMLAFHGIEPMSVFCYPGGYFDNNKQLVLSQLAYTHALTVSRKSDLRALPKLIGRVGIHNDITHTQALFALRLCL